MRLMRTASIRTRLLCFAILAVSLFAFGQASGERRVVRRIAPTYPIVAKSMHLTGTVRLAVTVERSGTVGGSRNLAVTPS